MPDKADKPDKFDPYREALVVEVDTVWPDAVDDWSADARGQLAARLHDNPEVVSHMQYVRLPTGFCRRILVTADDLKRFG
jgi:hypothetical protein